MGVFELYRYLRQRPWGTLVKKVLRLWRETGGRGVLWRYRLLHSQTFGYARWLQAGAARLDADCAALDLTVATMNRHPLISVVMPVCDPPEQWLRRAIESVRGQRYPHWQLCIADDASTLQYVRPLLEAVAATDQRIRVVFRAVRGHICSSTRTALALADGEYITFLDHDDELEPLALARVAAEIAGHPGVDLIYGDEDMIGTDGGCRDPYFKPDWNPELLRAQNYICHLAVYRAELLRSLDAFRSEMQGSQDWDLALRASEQARCIRHIPHVLYHWRTVPGSVAHSDTAKVYALEAGRRAVQKHLERCAEKAGAELLPFGHVRVRHTLPAPPPSVSLIVTKSAGYDALAVQTRYPDMEVLLANDEVDLVPQGIARSAAKAKGDILCFVDGRCRPVAPGWLDALAALAIRPDVGAVGPRLVDSSGCICHAGYLLDPLAVVLHPYRGAPAAFPGLRNRMLLQQNVSAVSAACFAVSRAAFDRVGGFDTEAGACFGVDFCLRLGCAGLRSLWTPHATLVLDAPIEALDEEAIAFMRARWGEQLAHDPAGNPNLVLVRGLPVPASRHP